MKRSIWTAAAAIILAAAVAIPVIAQPPQGGRGPGRGPGMGGPMPMLRGLNLTDAQREEIKTLTEQRRTGEDPRRNLMDLERQLQSAILADTPDQQKIEQLRNSISAASAQDAGRAYRTANADRADPDPGTASPGARVGRKRPGSGGRPPGRLLPADPRIPAVVLRKGGRHSAARVSAAAHAFRWISRVFCVWIDLDDWHLRGQVPATFWSMRRRPGQRFSMRRAFLGVAGISWSGLQLACSRPRSRRSTVTGAIGRSRSTATAATGRGRFDRSKRTIR